MHEEFVKSIEDSSKFNPVNIKKGELLANGEMFEVIKIMKEEFIYEMDFINIRIRVVNNK